MNISYKSPGALEQTRFEKIHSVIFEDSKKASRIIAKEISDLIIKKQKQDKNCVLGLATGSSPISVYQELVRMYKEDGLSFRNVVAFNLDEYFPMTKKDINLSLIHISEPTRQAEISYAVFCLKKKTELNTS